MNFQKTFLLRRDEFDKERSKSIRKSVCSNLTDAINLGAAWFN